MIIRARQVETSGGVDLTPIIDMVFLLLIFFLVATTFHQTEREMKIALPVANSSAPISVALREIIINVRADGTIIVNGGAMADEQLQDLIETAVKANPQQKVTVRGDREAGYGSVVRALDICKRAGIQQPFLDTVLGR